MSFNPGWNCLLENQIKLADHEKQSVCQTVEECIIYCFNLANSITISRLVHGKGQVRPPARTAAASNSLATKQINTGSSSLPSTKSVTKEQSGNIHKVGSEKKKKPPWWSMIDPYMRTCLSSPFVSNQSNVRCKGLGIAQCCPKCQLFFWSAPRKRIVAKPGFLSMPECLWIVS